MVEKTESGKIYVKRLEEGPEDCLKVVFKTPYGEHSILAKKEDIRVFCPGTEYEGTFKVSGMPDLIGQKDEWENVCTINSSLEKIVGENICFKTREKTIIYKRVEGTFRGMFEKE